VPRPKRPTRARKIAVSDLEWAFLNDAIDIDGDPALYGGTGMRLWELTYNFALGGTRHPTTDLWEEYDTVIVEQWAIDKPGTRPSCWWSFSAPRGELQSFWNDFNLPESRLFAEPRRRLGGTGTPLHEVMAFAPSFSFGIPTRWPEAEHLDGTVASGSCINGVPVCRVYAGRRWCWSTRRTRRSTSRKLRTLCGTACCCPASVSG
jgi:hypothetical protein